MCKGSDTGGNFVQDAQISEVCLTCVYSHDISWLPLTAINCRWLPIDFLEFSRLLFDFSWLPVVPCLNSLFSLVSYQRYSTLSDPARVQCLKLGVISGEWLNCIIKQLKDHINCIHLCMKVTVVYIHDVQNQCSVLSSVALYFMHSKWYHSSHLPQQTMLSPSIILQIQYMGIIWLFRMPLPCLLFFKIGNGLLS